MTTYTPKRHERGTTLHRFCNDDVQGFGEWLVFMALVLVIVCGIAFVVAVAGFGWREPLELLAEWMPK